MDKKKDNEKPPARETEFPLLKDDTAPDISVEAEPASLPKAEPTPAKIVPVSFLSRFREEAPEPRIVTEKALKAQSRRDFLLYGAGAIAAAAGFLWVLPQETQNAIGIPTKSDSPAKERFLNKALTFDDLVARDLYSSHRLIPTYSKSQVTPNLINNYNGQTPDPGYIPDWRLTVAGLASGKIERFGIEELLTRFAHHEQITRLVCVEGWSAIAWWGGLRFADFLAAFPPIPGAKWARLDSSVNLDSDGNPDPYYVSIDLPTAQHPQTLLATHRNGEPLTVDYGAPLRLVAPMKLGLKNIKAITKITYTIAEPDDYWAVNGYSKYDGV